MYAHNKIIQRTH